MRIICPKNPGHVIFSVAAHVVQYWQVNTQGDFEDVQEECSDVIHRPEPGDLAICLECNTETTIQRS